MKRLINYCIAAGFLFGMAAAWTPAPAQSGEAKAAVSKPEGATETANAKGLGGLFADSIQNLLKGGNVFVPNGKSAQSVGSATPGGPEKFKLNFNNAPIDQVLKFLSDMTKKVILKSDDVNGQFTIINPNDVTKDDAMKIIDAAFMLKGFTFLESEQIIVVLPTAVAKQKGVDVEVGAGKEGLGSRVQSRVIPLKYASPSQMKDSLTPLVAENANIIADERTKTLVITDTYANINRLVAIIEQLDKKENLEGLTVRVLKLRYAVATELARDLGTMVENIVNAKVPPGVGPRDRRGGRSSNVQVLSDRVTNSLIIAAPVEAMQDVEDFIKKMDVPSSQNLETKTFTLRNGTASEIAQSLNQIAQSRTSMIYKPVVAPDNRTNTVIVSAYPEDVESFGRLIEILDSGKSYEKLTKVYPLIHADAIILSETLKQLIGSDSQSRNNNYNPWYYDYGYSSSNRRGGQQQNEVRIIEDQRMNALIITARPADFPMIEDLIKQLDTPLPVSKEEPRVYPVKNVRASDVATLINNLFTQNQQNMGFFFGYNQQQQGLTGLTGKVKVLSDPTTNSIIVIAGTPRAFEVVEKLIKELDRISPEFGTTKVYHLKNADAGYLAIQMNQLFQEDRSRQANRGFFWYLNNSSQQEEQISNLIGNVRIVSETRTNALMVTTSSQYFDAIEKLIQELDKEISQVLIEILIVEVTDLQNNNLGINWPDNIPITVKSDFNAPLNAINPERATILSSANFSAVVNLLASNNKTNVVARPNIFTRDNQGAYVEVINRVPVVKSVSYTSTSTIPQTGYEEVGLKLTVTPHINDATTVTIDVNLVNGQILETLALDTGGIKVPAFSQRTILTKLTVNNLETAVLSGVIDTAFYNGVQGVPGLMHIPILGNFFKSKTKKQTKTEMMAFITPYILGNSEDRGEVLKRHESRIDLYKGFKEQMDGIKVHVGKTE